ncbi:glutamate--tRNA ligase [bacterium]|nr:glutamate--tRNA ligase [bacterium]
MSVAKTRNAPVRVRFAPSPTGHLHIGSVRTAIFNWVFARRHAGTYVVRIEDTDLERSKKEYVDSISNSLKWLQLESDEPVVFQRDRSEVHVAAAKMLMKKGLAYPCFCDKAASGKPEEIGKKYDKVCCKKIYTEEDLQKPHCVRFKLPEDITEVAFKDLIRGEVKVALGQLDDFVIVRRDGSPTYNFVVVLDDIEMEISHVIRGEDHISNTPKQILIYRALGKMIPEFVHLPLILGPTGSRLSKRDGAVSVTEYRDQGFLPEALFNYLVRLGWAHGDVEMISREELVRIFNFDDVNKKGAMFDQKKLDWLNGVYIREATIARVIDAMTDVEPDGMKELREKWDDEALAALVEMYRSRASRVTEIVSGILNLARGPEDLNLSLIEKWRSDKTGPMLNDFYEFLANHETNDAKALLEAAKGVAVAHGAKLVGLAQPLRLAITGGVCSPGIFEIMLFLDESELLARVKALKTQLF